MVFLILYIAQEPAGFITKLLGNQGMMTRSEEIIRKLINMKLIVKGLRVFVFFRRGLRCSHINMPRELAGSALSRVLFVCRGVCPYEHESVST